jgi:DNA-binding response OmpR family regulator/DNA-binding CsgD family transcriptional regulator
MSEATKPTVLVVDDAPDTLRLLTDALDAAGMRVMVALDGAAALRSATRLPPDIVLLDAVMPELDGFATCRRLKALSGFDTVPVIFMTGLSEPSDAIRGFEAGGADYVTKPIVIEAMIARMRVHLLNAERLRAARQALDATDQYLVAATESGNIRWFTPQAYRLLESHLLDDGALRLPPDVAAWLKNRASASQGVDYRDLGRDLRLSFVRTTAPGELLFKLSRRSDKENATILRARFGLTSRETEVVTWLSRGKSNRDIADILFLSPRTVDKHLEVVFAKLNVENRTAAAALVLDALRERPLALDDRDLAQEA